MVQKFLILIGFLAMLVFGACSGSDAPVYSGGTEVCAGDEDCAAGQVCNSEGMCEDSSLVGEDVGRDVGGGSVDASDDTAVTDDTTEDSWVGAPCDDGDDCPSGYCIEAANSGRRVCTDFCDTNDQEACPEGYSCAAVSNSGADITFLCFPVLDILCTPCDSDSDCGGLADLCLSQRDGDFCAQNCQLQACPDGYTCTEVEGEAGAIVSQCLPDTGICSECFDPDGDSYGEGAGCLGEDCDEENPEVNAGAFESCNGEDDNCNGDTDEGYNLITDPENCGACGNVCTFEGAEALCADRVCLRGPCLPNRYDIDDRVDNGCEYFCEASADGVELCNGRDDDCDGTIDEGNPDAGGACDTGQNGVCAQGIEACDGGRLLCVRQRDPLPESCNGEDDNCDGRIDESNPGGGAACNTGGMGVCSEGTLACLEGGLMCQPLRESVDEVCNGRDDNCDGRIDEGNPGGGAACDTGEMGVCGVGVLRCMGSEVICVQERQASDELCNGEDDNCNGVADEGNPEAGGVCDTGEDGVCGPGVLQCAEGGLTCRRNVAPSDEVCNGIDDNCVGGIDESNPGGGGVCDTGEDGICAAGTLLCEDGGLACQRNSGPQGEVCDGIDNDCNGTIDDGQVCGPFIQQQCRIFAGWADNGTGPDTASSTWANCPSSDRDNSGDQRCVGTRGDGRFARLQLGGDVNSDDELAVALLCSDNANPGLASYVQSHCSLYIGQADNRRGTDSSPAWGDCPTASSDNDGEVRCTSSGFDGRFRRMLMTGDVNGDDQFAVAWKCVDNNDPGRAAALQSAASVFIGWADRNEGPIDGSSTWGPCPSSVGGASGGQVCTSSRGDGLFHLIEFDGDVNGDDQLGWALRAR